MHNNTIKTSDTVLRKIYLSLYRKGCVWEGVGGWTELQNIDPPNSSGYNSISFPFSWAAQPGAAQPGVRVFSTTSYLQLVWSPNWLNFLCSVLCNCSTPTFLLCNCSTPTFVKVIFWYSSTGCTCYLHKCISYLDSPAESEVNIQHLQLHRNIWLTDLLTLNSNAWKHLTVCKQRSSNSSFQNKVANKLFAYKSYIYIYIYIKTGFVIK